MIGASLSTLVRALYSRAIDRRFSISCCSSWLCEEEPAEESLAGMADVPAVVDSAWAPAAGLSESVLNFCFPLSLAVAMSNCWAPLAWDLGGFIDLGCTLTRCSLIFGVFTFDAQANAFGTPVQLVTG